jgi:hypothetical protein
MREKSRLTRFAFCLSAGMAAALASVFGKLALSDFISLPAKVRLLG